VWSYFGTMTWLARFVFVAAAAAAGATAASASDGSQQKEASAPVYDVEVHVTEEVAIDGLREVVPADTPLSLPLEWRA
jgi:hypothetical protein